VDTDRLAGLIASIGVEGARWIEENIDEQFRALRYLHGHIGDPDAFPRLVVANALVSYQLSGRGEDWWWEFARWFSENPVNGFQQAYRSFLPKSRNNRRLVEGKVKRLGKVEAFLQQMDPQEYYENMVLLRDELAKRLNSPKTAKTIVFAVKMFGYAMRVATGRFRPYPTEIPIPLDSRIERATRQLTDENPLRFWNRIAEETEVPPLHIDSLLWPALSGDPVIREEIKKVLGKRGEELIRVISP